jgi:hypothetical protein
MFWTFIHVTGFPFFARWDVIPVHICVYIYIPYILEYMYIYIYAYNINMHIYVIHNILSIYPSMDFFWQHRVWIQGLTLARPVLLPPEPLHQHHHWVFESLLPLDIHQLFAQYFLNNIARFSMSHKFYFPSSWSPYLPSGLKIHNSQLSIKDWKSKSKETSSQLIDSEGHIYVYLSHMTSLKLRCIITVNNMVQ